MTCVPFGGGKTSGIICVSPYARLHLGNKYVWMDFHTYCGPQFWKDYANTIPYDPVDENDPIWPLFEVWLKKYNAKIAKQNANKKLQSIKQLERLVGKRSKSTPQI